MFKKLRHSSVLVLFLVTSLSFYSQAQEQDDKGVVLDAQVEKPVSDGGEDTESDPPQEVGSPSESAKDDKPEADAPGKDAGRNVSWYFPETRETKQKKTVRVLIAGKSVKGAKVYVGASKIPIIRNGKVRKLSRSKAFVSKKERIVTADANGLFIYPLNLPTGDVRLPLVVRYPDGFKQNYQLNLNVTPKEVVLTNQSNLTRSPSFTKKYELWFGAGFNYVRYSQESPEIPSDLLFESFKLPSLFLKGRANIIDKWGILYTYKLSPGETSSGESVQVNQGTYNWQTHTLEGVYSPTLWKTKIFKTQGQWAIRFGLQHHLVPFLDREADNIANITTNSVSMASFGAQYQEVLTNTWDFEFYMRVQHPLSVGDKFEIDSIFAFDGSLGMVYNFRNGLRLGGFWYGQMQTYKYTALDTVLAKEVSGDQTLFYSNIDVRLGYAFD